MKLERDELPEVGRDNAKILAATLKTALGVDEKAISQAMKVSNDQYTKYFQSYASKDVYKAVRSQESTGEMGSTKAKAFDQASETALLEQLARYIGKIEDFHKMPVSDVSASLRKELDQSYEILKVKPGPDEAVTRRAEVLNKLTNIRLATLINFVNNVSQVVAKSLPESINQNRAQGMAELMQIKNELQQKNDLSAQSQRAKESKMSVIERTDKLVEKCVFDRNLDTHKALDLKNHLVRNIQRVEELSSYLAESVKLPSLTNVEKGSIITSLNQVLEKMDNQMKIIEGKDALESFRDSSPVYQQYKGLADKLRDTVVDYSAAVKQERTVTAQSRTLQRQASLTDDQYQKAVEDYEQRKENKLEAKAANPRPSWTNNSRPQSAQVNNMQSKASVSKESRADNEARPRAFSFNKQ